MGGGGRGEKRKEGERCGVDGVMEKMRGMEEGMRRGSREKVAVVMK